MIPDTLGLPLEAALKIYEDAGIGAEVTVYKAKRTLEGADDLRVIRWTKDCDRIRLVVSAFSTEI